MLRPISSVLALCAAMSVVAPAIAADIDENWGDQSDNGGLRMTYPTEPGDWAGLGDKDDPLKFEFGARYWYSMGALNFNSNGSTLASTDTTHIGELHLRIEDHSTNTFVKALAGYSIASSGSFDAPLTSGSITDGHVGYFGADIGWDPLGDNNGSGVGFLVGYQYWKEALDSGRTNYTTATTGSDITITDPVTGATFVPGDSAPNSLDMHLLRLGVTGKANLGDFFDISAEVAGVPYAKINGQVGVDDPTFDTSVYSGPAQIPYNDGTHFGNISSMRASPTSVDGWGYGAMAEAWLGVHPSQNLTFRLGGRAWYLQGSADETYTRDIIGPPTQSTPPAGPYDQSPSVTQQGIISTANPFALWRYGLLAEMTYAF